MRGPLDASEVRPAVGDRIRVNLAGPGDVIEGEVVTYGHEALPIILCDDGSVPSVNFNGRRLGWRIYEPAAAEGDHT